MDVLLDLKLDEEAERVEVAMAGAVRSFSLEGQYRGALRFVRRLSREIEALHKMREQPVMQQPAPASEPATVSPAPPPATASARHARPPWKARGLTMWQRTYRLLEAHPRMPYAEMAEELYGSTDAVAKSNVRSQMDQLKKKGMVRRIDDGIYEVIPLTERKADTGEAAPTHPEKEPNMQP